MASIKVKFRTSSAAGKEGTIYYQVIHNRIIRQLKTDYRIFADEWNEKIGAVVISVDGRNNRLQPIKDSIGRDVRCLESIVKQFENKRIAYSVDDIVAAFNNPENGRSLFRFMHREITRLEQMGRHRTSETYRAALRSFTQFRENKDVLLDEIDSDMMQLYEAYLRNKGLTPNSSSFYMRILRAVYNRAVEKDLIQQRFPFRHVYTGTDKTVKRAIPLIAIKRIKDLDLSLRPTLDLARDMFLFSFYTRGMSFIDMAYLKKKNLVNGFLSYRRRKTGQQLFIKWEKCMQEIVDKYPESSTDYLLPIIKTNIEERRQYSNAMRLVNNKLKEVAKMAGLQVNLTMYVSRHSWASIAKNKKVPLSVISAGMGHDSEMTTQIYLASLDSTLIDKANSLILRNL